MNPTASKPQKSLFWLWTTLWLTAFIDSGLIFSVFIYVLEYLPESAPLAVQTFLSLLILLISLWLGAYFAVKYVLKRSIVVKSSANKLAGLAIVIPVIFWFIKFWLGDLNLVGVIMAIITVAIIYYSIKKIITTQGD